MSKCFLNNVSTLKRKRIRRVTDVLESSSDDSDKE